VPEEVPKLRPWGPFPGRFRGERRHSLCHERRFTRFDREQIWLVLSRGMLIPRGPMLPNRAGAVADPGMQSSDLAVRHDRNESGGAAPPRAASYRWLWGAAVLILTADSLALSALQATVSTRGRFVASNALPPRERDLWLWVLLGVSVACALACMVFAILKRANAGDKILRAARVVAPLLLAWSFPSLLIRGPWRDVELRYLIFLGTVLLCLEPLLRVSLSELGTINERLRALTERAPQLLRRWAPRGLVLAAIIYYAIRVSQLTLLSHERLATTTSDLGEFDNLFFNALYGHPYRAPAMTGDLADWSALKIHAEFVLYVLLPFYALAPGPAALLVIQSTAIALTAVPVYLLAAARVGRPVAVILAGGLLLLPAVERPNFYDFHFPPFGMLFATWALYFADRVVRGNGDVRQKDRAGLFGLLVFFVLALLSREEMAVGLAMLGIIMTVARPESAKLGLVLAGGAVTYFLVMKFVVMPSFGAIWLDSIYDDLKAQGGSGVRAVAATVLTNPAYVFQQLLTEECLLYVLHLSVPLAFLWWRRVWLLLAAVPGILFTLLVTNRDPLRQISFQYAYFWIPYVVAASVYGLAYLRQKSREHFIAAGITLLFGVICASYQFGALLGNKSIIGGFGSKQLFITENERARFAQLRELTRQIPKHASVGATEHEGPHVSTRVDFFSLKLSFGDPDYLLLGRIRSGGETDRVKQALRSRLYGLQARSGEFTLLRRGADPSGNAALLRSLLPREK
jgi:uncharacterized membrane protein